MPDMPERRQYSRYTEELSSFMLRVSAAGGAYVLIDPVFTFTFFIFGKEQILKIGGEGFSADLKGAVVSLILIGGWTALKEFWLGSSASGQTQSESMSKIAETMAKTPEKTDAT